MYARYVPPISKTQNPPVEQRISLKSTSKKRKRGAETTSSTEAVQPSEAEGLSSIDAKVRDAHNGGDRVDDSAKAIEDSNIDAVVKTKDASTYKPTSQMRTGQVEIQGALVESTKSTNIKAEYPGQLARRTTTNVMKSVQSTNSKKDRLNAGRNDPQALSLPEQNISDISESEGSQRSQSPDESSRRHKDTFSKYRKAVKSSSSIKETAKSITNKIQDEEINLPAVPRGLEPIPQPKTVHRPSGQPQYSTLPPWIANPIIAPAIKSLPFKDFNLNAKTISHLKARGYENTLSIQSTVLPLLLTGSSRHDGDICISAATGSGKTLAYVLPMVEKLRKGGLTMLRGIVVLPTRELVVQVKDIFDLCAVGSNLKIQTATGTRPFKAEKQVLTHKQLDYRPRSHHLEIAPDFKNQEDLELRIWQEIEDKMNEIFEDDRTWDFEPELDNWSYTHVSNVDILICTPGRLVDHLRNTKGFSLDDLEWLVIDEADRLLDESFQEWAPTLMETLYEEKPLDQLPPDEELFWRLNGYRRPRNITKVVLSATMTRSIQKLNGLRLRNPRLITMAESGDHESAQESSTRSTSAMHLPPGLKEWMVPVGDSNFKPLYLHYLLRDVVRLDTEVPNVTGRGAEKEEERVESDTTSDDSESLDSTSSSDSSNDSSSSEELKQHSVPLQKTNHSSFQATNLQSTHGVLVFTSSNESAVRLARLLRLLEPKYASAVTSLTSNDRTSDRLKTVTALRKRKIAVIVASDLLSRGLDIDSLAHVISYDLPTSIKGYVHRVGRTARAGKKGQAWTLATHDESVWFWKSIGNGKEISRREKVEKVKVKLDGAGKEAYERALKELSEEVRKSS